MRIEKRVGLFIIILFLFCTRAMAVTVVEEIEMRELGGVVSGEEEDRSEAQRQADDEDLKVNVVSDEDVGPAEDEKIILIKKHKIESCPFDFASLCFQPAVGAVYARRDGPGEYKDIRLAAIIHEDFSDNNRFSMNALVVPGENFIDSLGLGVSTRFMRLRGLGNAVLSIGASVKKYNGEDNVRGGGYLMFSFSPYAKTYTAAVPVAGK